MSRRTDNWKFPFRMVALVVPCLLSVTAGCVKEPENMLRIGINTWPGYEFLYLAQEKGFYQEEGLDVKLLEFNSLSDARRAYERGQLDGLGTSVIDALQTLENSERSPQIVQVIDYSDGADVILAKPGIRDLHALRGGRVGVELGSLGIYLLARGLEKHGLGLGDVKMTSMDQMSMMEAISKGMLDAIVTYPPTSLKLVGDFKAENLFTSSEIPGEIVDVIIVDEQVIKQRPSDISKLLRAYQKAMQFTRQHPDEAYKIMAAREGITPDEFGKLMQYGIHIISKEEQAEFFLPGGKLEKVIDMTDRILRQSVQIKGTDRRAGLVNASFALQDNGK